MFDGVICLGGEDWWYHNRGHYDMQMMRELSRDMPVLFVNSVGMRVPTPREGRMFLTRVRRKLRSFRRGMVRVRENFSVTSPPAVPGRIGGALTTPIAARRIGRESRSMGIRRPLLWVANPRGAEFLDAIEHVGCVYQRTDRFEDTLGVDHELLAGFDRRLKSHADMTIYCSEALREEEADSCAESALIDHGVDYEVFERASASGIEPEDVRTIPRPRVGFVGGIDAHKFDPELFLGVARRLSNFQFVLVGACSLPEGWCDLRNVHLLGRRPYDDVASYMSSCDVLILPLNDGPWVRASNPVKLKEYLATGKPVVKTPHPRVESLDRFVRVGSDVDSFARQISRAISEPHDPGPARRLIASDSWGSQANRALASLEGVGVRPMSSGSFQNNA